MVKQASKPEAIEKPKSAEKKAKPTVDKVAVMDKLNTSINALRSQLKRGEKVALPGMILQLLPEGIEKGDRKKVMDWRSFVVWAEWTGSEWDTVVYKNED